MFSNLLKAVVGVVVETPIAIVADVATLGGTLTDEGATYTAKALGKVVDNVRKSTED